MGIIKVKEIWECNYNYCKIWKSFALISFKNYSWFEKLLLKLLNTSSRENKENHYRDRGLDM